VCGKAWPRGWEEAQIALHSPKWCVWGAGGNGGPGVGRSALGVPSTQDLWCHANDCTCYFLAHFHAERDCFVSWHCPRLLAALLDRRLSEAGPCRSCSVSMAKAGSTLRLFLPGPRSQQCHAASQWRGSAHKLLGHSLMRYWGLTELLTEVNCVRLNCIGMVTIHSCLGARWCHCPTQTEWEVRWSMGAAFPPAVPPSSHTDLLQPSPLHGFPWTPAHRGLCPSLTWDTELLHKAFYFLHP
jgi:hypothetical protein